MTMTKDDGGLTEICCFHCRIPYRMMRRIHCIKCNQDIHSHLYYDKVLKDIERVSYLDGIYCQ